MLWHYNSDIISDVHRESCAGVYLYNTRDFIHYRAIKWYDDLMIAEVRPNCIVYRHTVF